MTLNSNNSKSYKKSLDIIQGRLCRNLSAQASITSIRSKNSKKKLLSRINNNLGVKRKKKIKSDYLGDFEDLFGDEDTSDLGVEEETKKPGLELPGTKVGRKKSSDPEDDQKEPDFPDPEDRGDDPTPMSDEDFNKAIEPSLKKWEDNQKKEENKDKQRSGVKKSLEWLKSNDPDYYNTQIVNLLNKKNSIKREIEYINSSDFKQKYVGRPSEIVNYINRFLTRYRDARSEIATINKNLENMNVEKIEALPDNEREDPIRSIIRQRDIAQETVTQQQEEQKSRKAEEEYNKVRERRMQVQRELDEQNRPRGGQPVLPEEDHPGKRKEEPETEEEIQRRIQQDYKPVLEFIDKKIEELEKEKNNNEKVQEIDGYINKLNDSLEIHKQSLQAIDTAIDQELKIKEQKENVGSGVYVKKAVVDEDGDVNGEDELNRLKARIKNRAKRANSNLNRLQEQRENAVREIQKQIDELKESKKSIDKVVKRGGGNKEDGLQQRYGDIVENKRFTQKSVERLEQEINQLKEDRKETDNKRLDDQLKRQIEQKGKKIRKLKQTLKQYDRELSEVDRKLSKEQKEKVLRQRKLTKKGADTKAEPLGQKKRKQEGVPPDTVPAPKEDEKFSEKDTPKQRKEKERKFFQRVEQEKPGGGKQSVKQSRHTKIQEIEAPKPEDAEDAEDQQDQQDQVESPENISDETEQGEKRQETINQPVTKPTNLKDWLRENDPYENA